MYEVGNIYLWRGYTVMQDVNSEKCEYHRFEWYDILLQWTHKWMKEGNF